MRTHFRWDWRSDAFMLTSFAAVLLRGLTQAIVWAGAWLSVVIGWDWEE